MKLSKAKDEEKNLESSKREANCHTQGLSNKILSRFPNRNLTGQKMVGPDIQSTKRKKKLSTKNTIFSKSVLQK